VKRTTENEVQTESTPGRISDATLLILATLAKQPKHGHAMQKDIERAYGTRLGPGALYGAIERLEAKGLIAPLSTEERRKPYQITEIGQAFLRSQVAAMRRVTGDTMFPEAPVKTEPPSMPSYYAIEEAEVIRSEMDLPALKPPAYSADELPFQQFGGRRFEILTYLIKQEDADGAVVTLVKSSNDKGRDVLIHRDGKLSVVIQCKNLSHRFGPPDLWDELLKLVLHDTREGFIPLTGIVYELWAPGGLTEAADNIVANWPHSIVESEVKQAFDRTVRRYASLRSLSWQDLGSQVMATLSERIRLQRYEGVYLSHIVRGHEQIFARFFECNVVLRQEHVERSFQLQTTQIAEQVSQLVSERIDGDEIDADINDARDLIDDHKFKDAEILLRRLQSKKQHKLNKHQRYRIVSNLGAVAFGEGRLEEAATKFLEAVMLEPDEERARTNEVFAYFLRREFEKTYRLASERRRLYPLSTRLASLWVICAPSATGLDELTAELDSSLQSNHEVCVALSRRCMTLEKLELAIQYADTAIASAPKWSQPWVIRATAAVGYLVSAHAGLRSLRESDRKETLRRGLEDANKAMELAEKDGPWAKAEALTARAELFIFSQEIAKANADARAAVALDEENVNVHLALAQTLFLSGDMDQGIGEIERAYNIEARPDVVLMFARTLAQRAGEGDLKKAVEISTAVDLNDIPQRMRVAFVFGTMQCVVKTADWQLANSYVDRAKPLIGEAAAKSLRAFVLHSSGESEKALSEAADAAGMLVSDVDSLVKEFLAGLFMQLGQPASALPLFKDLFEANIPSFDGRRYVDCAARLHLDHVVMEACDVLYQRQGPDWDVIQFETQYLEKYDKNKAIQRLQEILKLDPNNKLAQVRLSVIGYQHRRPDLIRASMRDLPAVEELSVEYLFPTLAIMRYGEDSDLAIDYAYRYLRLHFDQQKAHEAYIGTVLFRADKDTPPDLQTVVADAAVLCQELPAGELRWFVLEGTDKPSRDFEEIPLDGELAHELLGKKVGDKFVLAPQSIGNREGVIKQIITKYVRRFQQCGADMAVTFGRSAMLQTMQIGSESEVGQPGLAALFNSVQERAKQLALFQSWYAEQPMSLHVYGDRFSQNAYEGLIHAAQTEGMFIKCTDGAHAGSVRALEQLRERPAIYVDLTAIATSRLLGLERIFTTQLFRFRLTEATWVELQNTFREDDGRPSGQGGTMGFHDGRYFFQQHDHETMAKHAAANRAFLESLQQNVEIVTAPELAAVEPKTRELLEQYLGHYGAETAVAAAKPDAVIWTDDLPQAGLAMTTFGASRVWSQVVLLSLTEAGILTQEEYSSAVAKLIGFGFQSTFFDSRVMLECAKIAEFRTSRFPLKQLIDVFQQASVPGNGLVREFLQFFVLLNQESVLDQYKAIIVQEFLDALWRNPGTHNAVLSLRSLSSRLFGLNVVAEAAFNIWFDNWRRSLNRPLL
jgi:DNA-binding PadR family transcriptional regulator/tetratricopeptide (TPR) repeat protein